MRILVTGGAGFIGSTFIKAALSRGHNILNVDKLTYAGSLNNLSEVQDNTCYSFVKLDICDFVKLSSVFFEFEPDYVIHLAAESHVDKSINGPGEFINTNIIGTFNVLEVARSYFSSKNCPSHFRLLHVSTDEVYGSLAKNSENLFTEETPYKPNSPYSASKASSDHLVRSWFETYGLPTLITNCSNNYGPFQFPEKLIPVVILNALSQKNIPIYGDGGNVRDWLFVEDHADALLLALEHGVIGASYNIGGNTELSNLELVETICSIMDREIPLNNGSYKDFISFVPDRPGHDIRYAIDSSLAKYELKWSPKTDFYSGLTKTIHWYLSHKEWWGNYWDKYQNKKWSNK